MVLSYISSTLVQVQCQLFCTRRMYCDFVVWTTEDIHIERVYPDEQFWLSSIQKAQVFFRNAVLPELIGKWFSRPAKPPTTAVSMLPVESDTSLPTTSAEDKFYCYCRGPESGEMIACDNSLCPYVWFHFDCLKLRAPPRSKKWFCPDCRKLPQFKKRKPN